MNRPNSPFLDQQFGVARPVLDHGFVTLVDYMGNEDSIVRAARLSYGKGTRPTSEDVALIRYLMRHRHTSPLEQCEIAVHMKLPIFVARQIVRHRTAALNEYSARYSILDREFYVPDVGQVAEQSKNNKQGRGEAFDFEQAEEVRRLIIKHSDKSYDLYEHLLNDDGEGNPVRPDDSQLARELARMCLSLNTFTQWVWKIDLHNLLHFLSLRLDPHAQYEARVYGQALAELVEGWVPNVWAAFTDYRLDAHTFSGTEMVLLRKLAQDGLAGLKAAHEVSDESSKDVRRHLADLAGLGSDRERKAFWAALGLGGKS